MSGVLDKDKILEIDGKGGCFGRQVSTVSGMEHGDGRDGHGGDLSSDHIVMADRVTRARESWAARLAQQFIDTPLDTDHTQPHTLRQPQSTTTPPKTPPTNPHHTPTSTTLDEYDR